MSQTDNFFNLDALKQDLSRQLADGMITRVFADDDAMISIVRIEPNMSGSVHSHPEEQCGLFGAQVIVDRAGKHLKSLQAISGARRVALSMVLLQ